jgi:hypothetical protein
MRFSFFLLLFPSVIFGSSRYIVIQVLCQASRDESPYAQDRLNSRQSHGKHPSAPQGAGSPGHSA